MAHIKVRIYLVLLRVDTQLTLRRAGLISSMAAVKNQIHFSYGKFVYQVILRYERAVHLMVAPSNAFRSDAYVIKRVRPQSG